MHGPRKWPRRLSRSRLHRPCPALCADRGSGRPARSRHFAAHSPERNTGTLHWSQSSQIVAMGILSGEILMEPRIDYLKAGRGVVEAMLGFEKNIRQSGPDESLIDLVKLRA